MEFERHSSGVAKAGLTTGIIGTSLGAINMLGAGAGLLGGLGGIVNPRVAYAAGACGCSEDHLIDRYEAAQQAKIAELETQIALRDANTFTDQKMLEMYKYVDGQLRGIQNQLCAQEVKNQQTADSFQIMSERMQCYCDKLETKICAETDARKCADNSLVNYMNATFYPKMVADVTTGTTTTAQTLFNPLPVSRGCNCGCNN